MTRTLEEIDQALQELEQTQVDQLVPGVFAINAQGQIEEKLSGILEAKGINFNEAHAPGEKTSSIRWLNSGVVGERIEGVQLGESHLLLLTATHPAGDGVLAITTNASSGRSSVQAGTGIGLGTTLFDSTGVSSFLQLGALANVKAFLGTTQIEWNGTNVSNATTISGFGGKSRGLYFFQVRGAEALIDISAQSPTEVSFIGVNTGGAVGAGVKTNVNYFALIE